MYNGILLMCLFYTINYHRFIFKMDKYVSENHIKNE